MAQMLNEPDTNGDIECRDMSRTYADRTGEYGCMFMVMFSGIRITAKERCKQTITLFVRMDGVARLMTKRGEI